MTLNTLYLGNFDVFGLIRPCRISGINGRSTEGLRGPCLGFP